MRHYAILALAALLTACGGGGGSGGSSTSTATGYFKDSNTQGVRYVSGAQTGTTNADGSFTYEVGNTVTFYVGSGTNVTLGSATGQAVITPVDLVPSGSTTSQSVQNMARFLMMLDTDGDPSNGITISSNVRTAAAGWAAVDFNQTEANFNTAMTSVVTSVGTADSRVATLPMATTARTHVEATLRCARSGAFQGTYSGGDTGKFGVLVNAGTGNVEGLGYSNALAQAFGLSGSSAMTLDQSAMFASGNATTGASFSGRLTSPNAVSGNWTNSIYSISGTFSGTRVGGALNAKYRFTGQFQNTGTLTSYGLYTFDIDTSNNVTGLAYDIPSGTSENLTGSVTNVGTTLSGTIGTGGTFTATINLAAGTLTSGTWSKSGVNGTFTASGCQLN